MMVWACPGCVVFLGLLAATIPACFALYYHRRAAQLADMRTSKVEELRPGPAKVKGRVVAREELLNSPMGDRPCVYYRFVVDERQKITRGSRNSLPTMAWVTVVDDVQSIDVTLEDGTGAADIDLREAEVVGKAAEKTSSVLEDPPERLKALLRNRYGRSTKGLLFNKTMSFTETVLADGAKVVVVGTVEEGRGGRLEFRRGKLPLVISDKGKKGVSAPYRRKALYCWLGAGFLLVPTAVLAFMAGALASQFAANADQNTAPPPAQNAPPPAGAGPRPQGALPNPPVPQANVPLVDQLLAELQAPDVEKRKTAAERMGGVPVDEEHRPAVKRQLEALLGEMDPRTAGAALKALQTWGDAGTVALLQRLFDTPGLPFRREVIETLGKFPGPAAADTLAGGLGDPRDRPAIADALREMGAAAEPSVLRRLAVAADSDEKGDLCFLLMDIGTEASTPALQRLARDPDPKVAVKAFAALNGLHSRPHDK